MKKFRLFLGLLTLVLLISAAAAVPTHAQTIVPPCSPSGPIACPPLVLTERNNGQSFVVDVGRQIIVQLPAKPYSRLSYNTAVLKAIPTIAVVPAPGTQVWGLQAVGVGTTSVIRVPYNDFKVSITVALFY